MKLHLGCGATTPDGWLNVDYALGARLARVPLWRTVNRRLGVFDMDWDDRIVLHDLTKPFPWPDGAADAVYSSHTLEHLSKQDGLNFLKECYRVLKHGGWIRIVVPDLKCYVDEYLDGTLPAENFVEALGVDPQRTVRVVHEVGSVGAASIPISLDRLLRSGRVRSGDRVLMTGVGAGLSFGAVLVRLP